MKAILGAIMALLFIGVAASATTNVTLDGYKVSIPVEIYQPMNFTTTNDHYTQTALSFGDAQESKNGVLVITEGAWEISVLKAINGNSYDNLLQTSPGDVTKDVMCGKHLVHTVTSIDKTNGQIIASMATQLKPDTMLLIRYEAPREVFNAEYVGTVCAMIVMVM